MLKCSVTVCRCFVVVSLVVPICINVNWFLCVICCFVKLCDGLQCLCCVCGSFALFILVLQIVCNDCWFEFFRCVLECVEFVCLMILERSLCALSVVLLNSAIHDILFCHVAIV